MSIQGPHKLYKWLPIPGEKIPCSRRKKELYVILGAKWKLIFEKMYAEP